eukprot:995802-Pleurochrysis_carterae.AAC.3
MTSSSAGSLCRVGRCESPASCERVIPPDGCPTASDLQQPWTSGWRGRGPGRVFDGLEAALRAANAASRSCNGGHGSFSASCSGFTELSDKLRQELQRWPRFQPQHTLGDTLPLLPSLPSRRAQCCVRCVASKAVCTAAVTLAEAAALVCATSQPAAVVSVS